MLRPSPKRLLWARIKTSFSGDGTGKGRKTSASKTLKTAVFAPIPRANERTALAVASGVLRSFLRLYKMVFKTEPYLFLGLEPAAVFRPHSSTINNENAGAWPAFLISF
jgi:hypothetical protein